LYVWPRGLWPENGSSLEPRVCADACLAQVSLLASFGLEWVGVNLHIFSFFQVKCMSYNSRSIQDSVTIAKTFFVAKLLIEQ
jgi:hypothetical protein